jgi:hypothetical protein
MEGYTATIVDRIRVRAWAKRVTERVYESQNHLRETVARHPCLGWVEIFLRMEGGGFQLELPPRPNFYVGMPFPEEQTLEDFDSKALESLRLPGASAKPRLS